MSGFTVEAAGGGLKLEANEHFLQKPFRKEDLCRKVRTILDGSE